MAHQEGSIVVGVPIEEVEHRLVDVATWDRFLVGVVQVRETAFQRYRLVLRNGGRQREVDAVIAAHPAEHRYSWHTLAGPRYRGELRLRAVAAGQTQVQVTATADPPGFLAGMSEMLGSSGTATLVDLNQLTDHLTGATP
jgi:uncharacterized membrane protein